MAGLLVSSVGAGDLRKRKDQGKWHALFIVKTLAKLLVSSSVVGGVFDLKGLGQWAWMLYYKNSVTR